MEKKRLIPWLVLLSVILVAGAGAWYLLSVHQEKPTSPVRPLELTYALDWRAGMDYVGVYMAKEKGFYANRGLAVNIVQGHGGPDAARLLASGTYKIGNCTGDSVVIAVSQGLGLISLAVTHQRSPVVLFAKKSVGIESPRDLIGKTIGMNYESIKFQQYLALLRKLGIDRSKIKEVGVGFDVTPLITGQVDALLGYVGDEPVQAIKAGLDIRVIPFSDYGVEMYNELIAGNRQWVESNPDTTGKVVHATLQGWRYSLDHPDEAVKLMSRLFPEQDVEFNRMSFDRIRPLLTSEATRTQGLGAQTRKGWQQTIDLLYNQHMIKKKPALSDVFTNQFLR